MQDCASAAARTAKSRCFSFLRTSDLVHGSIKMRPLRILGCRDLQGPSGAVDLQRLGAPGHWNIRGVAPRGAPDVPDSSSSASTGTDAITGAAACRRVLAASSAEASAMTCGAEGFERARSDFPLRLRRMPII